MTWLRRLSLSQRQLALVRGQSPPAADRFFESWKTFSRELTALLVGFKAGSRIVERLLRDHTLAKQQPVAVQGHLVVRQGGSGFVEIVLRLSNFLRSRAVLELIIKCNRSISRAARLLVLVRETRRPPVSPGPGLTLTCSPFSTPIHFTRAGYL
jgi:hypothetical protein